MHIQRRILLFSIISFFVTPIDARIISTAVMLKIPHYGGYRTLTRALEQDISPSFLLTMVPADRRHLTLITAMIDEDEVIAVSQKEGIVHSLPGFSKWLEAKMVRWYSEAIIWRDMAALILPFKSLDQLGKFLAAEFYSNDHFAQLLQYLQQKITNLFPLTRFAYDATNKDTIRPHISLARFSETPHPIMQSLFFEDMVPLRIHRRDRHHLWVGAYYLAESGQ